jgi:hypothetical protein
MLGYAQEIVIFDYDSNARIQFDLADLPTRD